MRNPQTTGWVRVNFWRQTITYGLGQKGDMSIFQSTLQRLIAQSGKSLSEIAELADVDRSYLMRLARGDKDNPSPETLVKIWIGICMDSRLAKADPTFVHGLAEMMLAAGLSRYATAKRSE